MFELGWVRDNEMDTDGLKGKCAQAPNASLQSSPASSLSTSSIITAERRVNDSRQGYSMHDWNRFSQTSDDLSGRTTSGYLQVTAQELAIHNVEADAWTCIRGIVYNITPFMKYHPGGKVQLMRTAGKESTTLFNKAHPWVNVERILSKCIVGVLISMSPDIEISGSQTDVDASGVPVSLVIPVPNLPKP